MKIVNTKISNFGDVVRSGFTGKRTLLKWTLSFAKAGTLEMCGKAVFERMPRLSEALISRKLARLSRQLGILSDDKVLTDRQDALTNVFGSL